LSKMKDYLIIRHGEFEANNEQVFIVSTQASVH
jgi:hypothetical protein